MPSPIVPDTFDLPALGRHAQLGELYSSATSTFFSVSLYNEIKNEDKHNIPVGYTDFKLSSSKTFEEKTSTMDISASLAVEVLSGLVKVEGSGSYLKDSKGNVEQECFAMSLLKRTRQERLLFEEERVDSKHSEKALELIRTSPDTPTHFVSSIVYGGSVVIDLRSIRTKLEDVESIKGELSVELQKLKGMVSLSGKGAVHLDEDLKKLNDKFELLVYGDFILPTPPKDLEAILKFVPDAAKAVGDGVPIMYTLQRVPKHLIEQDAITHELENSTTNQIATACTQLDDIRARFDTIRDSSISNQVLIPRLRDTIDTAYKAFREEYEAILSQLREYLIIHKKGGNNEGDAVGVLVAAIGALVKKQLSPGAPHTPKVLVDVEGPCRDFEDLVHVARIAGHSFIPIPNTPSVQSLYTTIIKLRDNDTIGLFLIPPLVHPVKVDTFSAASMLIRVGKAVYSKLKMDNYLCYVEDQESREDLQGILTRDPFFEKFDSSTAIRITALEDGNVAWKKEMFDELNLTIPQPPQIFEPGLEIQNGRAGLGYDIPDFKYKEPFTFIIEGRFAGHDRLGSYIVAINSGSGITSPGYYFLLTPQGQPELRFIAGMYDSKNVFVATKALEVDQAFSIALVQKISKQNEVTWSFYVNGTQEGPDKKGLPFKYDVRSLQMSRTPYPESADTVYTIYGNLDRVRVFQKALTQDEIKEQLKKPL